MIEKRLVLFVGLCLFLTSIVLATHIITTSAGATAFISRLEDVSTFYNFTINNSDTTAAGNITYVNITLPSGFSFTADTNGSNVVSATFNASNSILSWTNVTGLVMNLTAKQFYFNASASSPGTFNFSVLTINTTGNYQTNISVIINDTTPPASIGFVSPGQTADGNLSTATLTFNLSVSDNGVLSNITIRLYNSTRDQINITSSNSEDISFNATFLGLTEGVYYANASATDSFSNPNSSVTLRFILDTTAPSVTLTETEDSQTSITFNVSGTDGSTGVSSCSISSNSGTVSGQQLRNLVCSASYSVTGRCTDTAGNQGTTSGTFSTAACSGSSSSSTGSSSTTQTWTNTYAYSDQEFSTKAPYTGALSSHERVRILVSGQTHHIGVLSISGQTAIIEVASTPRNVTFNVGETKKFELTGDSYYDVSVTLRNIASSRANMTLSSIHEFFNITTTPASTAQNVSANSTSTSSMNTPSRIGGYITLVLVVLVGAGLGAYYFYLKRKRRLGLI